MLFRTFTVASFVVVVFSVASSLATPNPDYYRSQTLTRRSYDQVWPRDIASTPANVPATKPVSSSTDVTSVKPVVDSTSAVTAAQPAGGSTSTTAQSPLFDPATHQLLRAYYHQQEAERHLRKAKSMHLVALKLAAEGDKEGAAKMDMLTLDQIEKAQYDAKRGVHHADLLQKIQKTSNSIQPPDNAATNTGGPSQ